MSLVVTIDLELGERDAAAHNGLALALAREPKQNPARDDPARRLESLVGAVRKPRHGAVHTAGVLVCAQMKVPTVAPLPQLEQRRGQQRQPAGLTLDVFDQRLRQLLIDL